MKITSLQNPQVKHVVKLRDRRTRESEGLMLVEGKYEIEIALKSGLLPQVLYISPETIGSTSITGLATEVIAVSPHVFEKMSYRDNPDGWLAVFPVPERTISNLRFGKLPFVIVAEAVEKPGNLGAILRTADGCGVDALLVCDPRVDIHNHNVIRASRGTIFTVPTFQVANEDALDWLRKNGINILAATPDASIVYSDINMRQPVAIAVGTEDEGLSDFWLNAADEKVLIPMVGKVNSLNVSTATAIIAYEVIRQRNTGA